VDVLPKVLFIEFTRLDFKAIRFSDLRVISSRVSKELHAVSEVEVVGEGSTSTYNFFIFGLLRVVRCLLRLPREKQLKCMLLACALTSTLFQRFVDATDATEVQDEEEDEVDNDTEDIDEDCDEDDGSDDDNETEEVDHGALHTTDATNVSQLVEDGLLAVCTTVFKLFPELCVCHAEAVDTPTDDALTVSTISSGDELLPADTLILTNETFPKGFVSETLLGESNKQELLLTLPVVVMVQEDGSVITEVPTSCVLLFHAGPT
jgi:hypothetical protein